MIYLIYVILIIAPTSIHKVIMTMLETKKRERKKKKTSYLYLSAFTKEKMKPSKVKK